MKMEFLYVSIAMVTLVLHSQSIQTMEPNQAKQNTEETRNPHEYGRNGEIAYRNCVTRLSVAAAIQQQLGRNAEPVAPQNNISSSSNNSNDTFNRLQKK